MRISRESAETVRLRKVSSSGDWVKCLHFPLLLHYVLSCCLQLTWDFRLVVGQRLLWSNLCFTLESRFLKLIIKDDMYFIVGSNLPGVLSYRKEFRKYVAVVRGNNHAEMKLSRVAMELCWGNTAAWEFLCFCGISAEHLLRCLSGEI